MKKTLSSEEIEESSLRRRAALWLLLLGPFFFASYGGANWYASIQDHVGHVVFDWERQIPFVPWTIIPYWVIDIFYAVSLFICASRTELDNHVRRLLTAQVIAVCCFVLFPLQFSFEPPQAKGIFGDLFTALYSFDRPFNQAPSLHIALLIILWKLYLAHLPRLLRLPFHLVCALIAISVLTTYQHHFIDIPTGALLGWFCLWLWPDGGTSMLQPAKMEIGRKGKSIAKWYLLAGLATTVAAIGMRGTALWFFWPAVSLLFVALFYTLIGSKGFQKDGQGQMSAAAKWLLFPYLIGAWINSRLWTLRMEPAVYIDSDVWVGRFPSRRDIRKGNYISVVDVTAELPAPGPIDHWYCVPCLDLLLPPADKLITAAELIESRCSQKNGPVLVACALGYSRSAMAVAVWLLRTKRAGSVDEAIEMIRTKRPAIVLHKQHRQLLQRISGYGQKDRLVEFSYTKQNPGEPRRRWFLSDELDLIVWFDDADQPISFQFCYDKHRAEHALTWSKEHGYMHLAVDDGDNPDGFEHKKAPMMVANGDFDIRRIIELFNAAKSGLPEKVSNFVLEKLTSHPNY